MRVVTPLLGPGSSCVLRRKTQDVYVERLSPFLQCISLYYIAYTEGMHVQINYYQHE